MPISSSMVEAIRGIPHRDPNQYLTQLEDSAEQDLGGLRQYDSTFDAIRGASTQDNREEEAARAREQSGRLSDNMEGQLERQQRALGLNLTARQKASQVRSLGLTRAISRASGVTSANRATADIAVMANRAGAGLGEQMLDLAASGQTQLANAEGQRNARAAREEAADDASRNSMIGTVVGAGLALSSEAAKDKLGPAENTLDKLRNIRVERWNYKGDDEEHIGPYAEEFNRTFKVGRKAPRFINLVDALGVALSAVKELDQKVEARG